MRSISYALQLEQSEIPKLTTPMTLFNLLAPAAATFYKHPNFESADDIVPDLKGKIAIVTGGTGGSSEFI